MLHGVVQFLLRSWRILFYHPLSKFLQRFRRICKTFPRKLNRLLMLTQFPGTSLTQILLHKGCRKEGVGMSDPLAFIQNKICIIRSESCRNPGAEYC